MKRIYILQLITLLIIKALIVLPSVASAQKGIVENWHYNPDKKLNPNTKWLREAKWGLFTHFIGGVGISGEEWNKRVNSFNVKEFANQLSELKVPYFFLTIGREYFCSPNKSYERLFGPGNGKLSDRDLVADLATELNSRGIKLCLYISAVGRWESVERQEIWRQVITEWSERYGKSISAWWIDGAVYQSPGVFKAYTAAFKSGNPNALVSYNIGPVGMNRDQLLPVTEYEDYLAGECDFILPTCGIRVFDGKKYYLGPNISGDQLHFLNFLGSWWGGGEPRFANDLVISWTNHINDFHGTVTWDLPLTDEGIIPEKYYNQIKALSNSIKKGN